MKKIIATNHDSSNNSITVIRTAIEVERTVNMLKQCGYQTIEITDAQ